MPALLQATSRRPKCAMAWDTRAWHSSALPTSAATNSDSPPWERTIAPVSTPASASMSDSTSSAPSRAAVRAMARPMPEAAPVTSTTLFFSMGSIRRSAAWGCTLQTPPLVRANSGDVDGP